MVWKKKKCWGDAEILSMAGRLNTGWMRFTLLTKEEDDLKNVYVDQQLLGFCCYKNIRKKHILWECPFKQHFMNTGQLKVWYNGISKLLLTSAVNNWVMILLSVGIHGNTTSAVVKYVLPNVDEINKSDIWTGSSLSKYMSCLEWYDCFKGTLWLQFHDAIALKENGWCSGKILWCNCLAEHHSDLGSVFFYAFQICHIM